MHTTIRFSTIANNLWHGTVSVVENVALARDTYRIRLECPEIARRIVPGQFLMLRMEGGNDPLLGRPLALYDVIRDEDGKPRWIDIVYLTIGKMTKRLAEIDSRRNAGNLGAAGQRFSAGADRSSGDGGGRNRPNAVRRLGQGISRPTSDTANRCPTLRRIRATPGRKRSRSATARKRPPIWPAWTISASAGVHVRLSTDDGIGRPSRVGHRVDRAGRRRGERLLPHRLLRAGADARRRRENRRQAERFPARSRSKRRWPAASASVSVAWRRFATQIGQLGLSPHLRRRPDLRRSPSGVRLRRIERFTCL